MRGRRFQAVARLSKAHFQIFSFPPYRGMSVRGKHGSLFDMSLIRVQGKCDRISRLESLSLAKK